MKTKLEIFRTRWRRFIGQKTRIGNANWVTLLDSNWAGWAGRIIQKAGFDIDPITYETDIITVYHRFNFAINKATMEDLKQLDELYVQDYLLRE